MREELERFLESIRQTPRQLEELRALVQTPEEATRWASDRGFHLTAADIAELRESEVELSDDELDQAAGGEDDWGSGGAPPPPGGG
ncbi:MAG TPA: Nif11-like leader peptide family RiPP precursor [Thermoanaerobaculia bacterium]|nr:Nif11-like leader peptide family RiPP precursor [Thermoanaerobaculia bacterium]